MVKQIIIYPSPHMGANVMATIGLCLRYSAHTLRVIGAKRSKFLWCVVIFNVGHNAIVPIHILDYRCWSQRWAPCADLGKEYQYKYKIPTELTIIKFILVYYYKKLKR